MAMISTDEKGELMKIALAIVVVIGVLAAVFCFFTRVLALMECTGGDLSEELEEQFLVEDEMDASAAQAADAGVANRQEVSV
jgi:hypothetical protein